jgi:hypothetical protein
MVERLLAAVRTGPSTTELRELTMPELPADGALLKVEVAGICDAEVNSSVAFMSTVLIQGPGRRGFSQAVAGKQALLPWKT